MEPTARRTAEFVFPHGDVCRDAFPIHLCNCVFKKFFGSGKNCASISINHGQLRNFFGHPTEFSRNIGKLVQPHMTAVVRNLMALAVPPYR